MFQLDPVAIGLPISSERRLWVAVMYRAVFDLLGVNTYGDGHYRLMLHHSARVWIESTNREPGSFEWICDQLEFNAGWLRCRLLRMAGKQKKGNVSAQRTVVQNTPSETASPSRLVRMLTELKAADPGPTEVAGRFSSYPPPSF